MRSPCPAYRNDARLAELQMPELFLLTLLRLRALESAPGSCERRGDWREGLEAIKVGPEGIFAFERLYDQVWSITTLEVRALRHPHLAGDEARLLRIIALLQHRRYAEVEIVAAEWLGAEARRILRAAMPLADQLLKAGMIVPLRHCEAASVDLLTRQLQRNRGLLLVH